MTIEETTAWLIDRTKFGGDEISICVTVENWWFGRERKEVHYRASIIDKMVCHSHTAGTPQDAAMGAFLQWVGDLS